MFTPQEIETVTGGKLLKKGFKGKISGVSIDSRTVRKGELFIPVKGPNYDGNDFVRDALKKGAVPLKTKNGLKALQALAKHHRNKFDIPVIGITGSSGKTTTKDMLASILSREIRTLKNEENLNNEYGLPLTLLKLKSSHEAAVIEMAMQGLGEIEELADIARPGIVIITNIGEAHLGKLKTRKNIAKAKSEIMKHADHAILPHDDEFFSYLKGKAPENCRIIPFGIVQMWRNKKFLKALPLPGRHNAYNALSAIKAAKLLGLKESSIVKGLRDFKPSSKRMEFIGRRGMTIINDSYNASPSSMKAALTVLAAEPAQRRIALLGDMLELGKSSGQYHDATVRLAKKLGIDIVLGIGKEMGRAGCDAGFSSNGAAKKHLKELVKPGDALLVKGSRGMKLEEVVDALRV